MKTFYGSIFMNKAHLEEADIKYPIELEYYKIVNDDEKMTNNKAKYGINIVKKEYIGKDTRVEEKEIKYISNDEQKINEVLETLKQHEVTPVGVKDVMLDLSSKFLFL